MANRTGELVSPYVVTCPSCCSSQMKIVYISSAVIPSRYANSIQIMKMCQAFAEIGNDVTLLAPHKPRAYERNVRDVFDYYGVDEVFKIKKLWWPSLKAHTLIYGLLCGIEVTKIRPDIVYGRYINGICGAALFGSKVIYEMHMPMNLHLPSMRSKLLNYLLNTEKLQHLVVISDALRDMIKDKVKGKKILVAPDGADLFPIAIQTQTHADYLSKHDSDLRVGYVGHLYPGKGGELIVDLAKALPQIKFHVFGGCQEDIDRLGSISPNNVVYHGFVPHSEVSVILSYFDVLLLPPADKVALIGGTGDIADFMSPLKMFEYMAAGKPIIASDLPVLREVLRHEYNALMVPPGNIEQWKAALLRLMKDTELRQRLGRQARNDLKKKYTWKIRAQKVLTGI